MDDVETPIERPDVIVPDTGPLIHLAQTDALHLLHQIGVDTWNGPRYTLSTDSPAQVSENT